MANRKEYEVETQLVFTGKFYIKADSPEQAVEYINKHCGLVLGGDIHTSLPGEMVNWDFEVHADKKCKKVKRVADGTIGSMNI